LNKKQVVIRRGDGSIAASGKLVNDVCVLAIRVCVPQHPGEVHLATQAETLQYGMNVLVIKISAIL
jgi:hypothetical protein